MAKDEVVLAFFDTEDAADDAVEALKAWDKSNSEVKLTSIGVMVLDDEGKLKTHKMGSRSAMKGAGVGLVAAVIFPPSLLAGIVGGGLLGSLHHKSLGLNVDERNRIAAELAGGKAAVGATVKKGDEGAVAAKLAELGGDTEVHEVTEEAVAEVEAVAPEVEAAEVAAGDDLTVIDGIGPDYSNSLRAAGVTTFAQLAEMSPEAIAELLAAANTPLIAGHDASTWPRQAKLAAAGDWSGLRRYVNSKK